MTRERERHQTLIEAPQTLGEVLEEWRGGRAPDFHVYDNEEGLREGDAVAVIDGPFEGQEGVVTLTCHGEYGLVAQLIGLRTDEVRVSIDSGSFAILETRNLRRKV